MRCYFNYFTSKNLKFHYGYFVVVLCILHAVCAQRPPYSLQAAVDELHRREAAKYPLNAPPAQHFFNGLGASSDMDYWDEDSSDFYANTNNNNRNRHKLNKALAKYLERENYEADPGSLSLGPFGDHEFDEDSNGLIRDEKKRSSFFRERDNEYDNVPASVFRERESPLSSGSELTEQFLHEIEETKEHERQEHLKDKLRELWEKYQQQDNELPNEPFEEKSKRMRVPPYYMLMQKRSYPVLPWLPYKERKKRFPVAKRSANRSPNDNLSFFKTDDKVAKELSELFGEENVEEDMKKRSLKEADTTPATIAQSKISDATTKSDTEIHTAKDEKNENDSEQMAVDTHGNEMQPTEKHAGYHAHTQKEHKHRKRSDHHQSQENDSREEDSDEHDEEEEEEEDEPEHEHDGDHDDEHEDAEGEDDEDEQKKKRDTQNMKAVNDEVSKNAQTVFKDLSKARAKKSVQWSKYFGIDRKKKAQSGDIQNRPTYDEKEYLDDLVKKRTKWNPDTLDNMDRKLQSIEDFIIDDAVKYTGAHEGITSPTEIRRLKDHVLSRLATAYSLEKMRRALDNLRLSQEKDKHLLQNVIESEENNQIKNNQKRLSVKKESVSLSKGEPQLPNPAEDVKEVNSNAMMSSTSLGGQNKNKSIIKNTNSDDDSDVDAKKKKQKKRNSYLRYPELPNNLNEFNEEIGPVHYEALNDAYLGNKNYIIGSNQCPLIETMADRCRGVDLLSGDLNQELLPACGVHQICYLCGTSQVACDYQYLAEADEICGLNNECQAAARSVLMILRGTPGRQLGPRACLKNPCLYSAMREIGL